MKYLEENINHISFPNTNHNNNNASTKTVGGSCAAVIGLYCFDPWILNMAGVEKELIQLEVFASDAVVLRLEYPSTTKKLVSLDTADIGSLTVTVISIVLMRLKSFAINSRTALCK